MNPTDNWLFFINPQSADGKGAKRWETVQAEFSKLGFNPVVWFSEYNGHIEQLVAKACKEGHRKIATFGGDGSLNAAVNGLMTQTACDAHEVLLAHYPSGTGNDWCRFFQVPAEPNAWVEMVRRDRQYDHDLGIIDLMKNGKPALHYFVNIAGLAYEAECAVLITDARKSSSLLQGKLFYDYIVLKGLFSFKAPELILEYNGKTRQQKMFNMCVAICKHNGGGMIPAPYANPSDGIFDVTTFDDMSKLTVLKDYPKLRAGTIFKNPKISAFRTEKLSVDAVGKPDHVEADGEYIGQTPATFTIRKQALRFVIGEVPEVRDYPF